MKNIKIFIFLLFISGNVCSQNNILIPSMLSNHKWGAVDVDHNIVIPYKYNSVNFYSYGYYLVELNGKKGLFNTVGKQMLPFEYDVIVPLTKSLFKVLVNGKIGVVDSLNNEILPIEFNTVFYKKDRKTFIVSNKKKYSVYSIKGNKITSSYFDNITFYGDKYFLFQKDIKFAIYKGVASLDKLTFYDDIVRKGNIFLIRDDDDWGALDSNCKRVLKPKYSSVELIENSKFFKVRKRNEYAFFNLEGKRITRFDFNDPFYFLGDNICWTQIDSSWYKYDFLKTEGEYLNFTKLIDTIQGYFRVVRNNYVELIDVDEEVFFSGKYQNIIPISSKLFKVQYDRKWGVIDLQEKIILDVYYDDIKFNTIVKKNEVSNYWLKQVDEVDVSKEVNYPETYTVRKNGKYGVYSAIGKEIAPVVFDEIVASVNKLFIRTKIKGKFNVYSREGVKMYDNDYLFIDWDENQKYFTLKTDSTIAVSNTLGDITKLNGVVSVKWSLKQGLFFDKQDGVKGLRNINSDTIISYKYKDIYDLEKDFFVGVVDSGVYLFNSAGDKLIDYKITSIEVVKTSKSLFIIVKKDDSFAVLDRNGLVVIPFGFSNITFDKNHQLFKVFDKSKFRGYVSLSGDKYFN